MLPTSLKDPSIQKLYLLSGKYLFGKAEAKAIQKANASAPRHCCSICGRTEQSHPDLEFRYCSKCEGSFEYCEDHLYTHQHVKKEANES